MKNDIDLHMHSAYSDDGEFSPSELVEMCYKQGIKIMAIADHNWVKGIDEAIAKAKEYQIKVIPAIEIDCVYKGIELHVLGYGIHYHNPVFNKLGETKLEKELLMNEKKRELVEKLGFFVNKEDLDQLTDNGVYTGEIFAEVLLNDQKYENSELLKPYRKGGSRGDNPYVNFYWDYFAQGKPCYTEVQYPSLNETIQLIQDNGGVAVLAHPGNNLKNCYEVFDEMVEEGIQGVECFSSYHSQETIDYFYNRSKELNLLITCGSDFHGKTKPAIFLGESGCNQPLEVEQLLKEYHLIYD